MIVNRDRALQGRFQSNVNKISKRPQDLMIKVQ